MASVVKTLNSHEYEVNRARAFEPLLHYSEGSDFDDWKKTAYDKLNELLGLPYEKGECICEIEYQTDFEKYSEYRFTVETEPGYAVPCHLLVPLNGKHKHPLTVCLSGHGGGMHVALGRSKCADDDKALSSWHHRAMALRSIEEGRAALVIEARNFGESSLNGYGTSCTEAAKIAILMGRTVIGERVWDAMRILDAVAARFDSVDMSNIVCTGNSGGGTATYYLACLDCRITVAAPSCSICSFDGSIIAMQHCMCNHVPSIRKYFEMGDLAGLIAPRRLVVAAGREDTIFPLDATESNFALIKSMYSAADAADNCSLVIGDGGHLNYADLIWSEIHRMGF